jgi:hypothetical protein
MRKLSPLTRLARRCSAYALGATVAVGAAAALPATASASHSQTSIIEDLGAVAQDPAGTLAQFRALGASTVRVLLPWSAVAPRKRPVGSAATDPRSYQNWALWDTIDRDAAADGLKLDLTLAGGAPSWGEATPPRSKAFNGADLAWKPNASLYGDFVRAVGSRYSGHFTAAGTSAPLPAIHFWAVFNEPNFGEDLGPQASNDSTAATAPMMYRGLVNAAYNGLRATGHARDTILIGELAAQGFEYGRYPKSSGGLPGNFGQTRPLLFIRELYCVDSAFRPLRGYAASSAGCPTTGGGSARFRRSNPGLFNASGFADHPYAQGGSPASRSGNKVDYATFPDLGTLAATLDSVNRAYGSGKRYPIYNTEYGYITSPPKSRPYPSPAVAAYYINWAEYLSWKSGRIASTMQYLLKDPPPTSGAYAGFASGLETYKGAPKATFGAYRLPVYMPYTNIGSGPAEIWGDARPAPFMAADTNTPQTVSIQLNGKTIDTVTVRGSTGYFDVRVKFPKSGNVRLAYTYPAGDLFLPVGYSGTVYSRSFAIRVK